MREVSKKPRLQFRWTAVLALGAILLAGSPSIRGAEAQNPKTLNVLVLLGEWFGDAYFPLAKEIESRGWTMKRIGLDGEYRGCYNKKRDVVLKSDIVIKEGLDLSGFDALIIPSGPQFRKFRENPSVFKFLREAHASGLLLASFCVGNFAMKDAGLIDLPEGPALFPEKVTLIKERILIGPRGGGPPPGDGFESAPIKEVCDAVARELAGKASGQTQAAIAGNKAPLTLAYVANMGVLVDSGGTKVLIDALFDKPNPEYRAPEPGVLDKILKGEAPYDGVKLALVTHNHPDHFAAGVAVRFLDAQTGAMLVAPADAVAEMRKVASDWTKLEPRVISLDLENGDFRRLKAAEIPITAVRTLHGSNESPMNLMYLFEINGRRIFHEGDSPGKPEIFRDFGLESAPVDLAILHYWFPLEPNVAKYLQDIFSPDHIALGHLPVRLESDVPGKIDMVRQYYQDLILLLPGIPNKTFLKAPAA